MNDWLSWAPAACLTIPLALLAAPQDAEACGCLSPPDPVALGADDFAVNQQAEQIIFEVGQNEDGQDTVTAHVLIRYAGAPEQFAWLVPVPNAPELQISEAVAFALIDQGTAPFVSSFVDFVCPDPEYRCEQHSFPYCGGDTDDGDGGGESDSAGAGTTGDGGDSGPGGEPPPGVDVIDMQQVGSYETVTFAANEAQSAIDWLQTNGFIVNDTMTPYMQPYIDAGMVFVAARLVAGAGIDEIAPLEMTYVGSNPMIPLQLTAVAAEPHLTVTSYIFHDQGYRPVGHPLVTIDETRIASDINGRINYPMVLSRAIDEAGGDGFVVEYSGSSFIQTIDDPSGCCGSDFDNCGIGDDTVCQCPGDEFDALDCSDIPGLAEGIELVERLGVDHTTLTRLTTRLSPEEMTFDPMFEPAAGLGQTGNLSLQGRELSLVNCEQDVLDQNGYRRIMDSVPCATTYCGEGSCGVTAAGAGCMCNPGFSAKQFTDLDGEPSVTCVPEIGTVDLGLNTELPDVCGGVECGTGDCVPVGGFPTCRCDAGSVAVVGEAGVAVCAAADLTTETPGAQNYTLALGDLEVCAPAPPECGQWGWLVPNTDKRIQGRVCPQSMADPTQLEIPPEPTCDDLPGGGGSAGGADTDTATTADTAGAGEAVGGCGCTASDRDERGWLWLGAFGLFVAGWRIRRAREPVRR